MNNIAFIVLGMMIVTYVPRLIPFYMLSGRKIPCFLKMFLEFVPYTALGALIIPGAFAALPDSPIAAIGGLGFAFTYSYIKGGLILPVVGSMVVAYCFLI